jgi:hypothetical protein
MPIGFKLFRSDDSGYTLNWEYIKLEAIKGSLY